MPTISGIGRPACMAVVPGGPANSSLAPVSGISVGDSLVVVRHITPDLATNVDVTDEASIVGADAVSLSTTATTGGFVVVVWVGAE